MATIVLDGKGSHDWIKFKRKNASARKKQRELGVVERKKRLDEGIAEEKDRRANLKSARELLREFHLKKSKGSHDEGSHAGGKRRGGGGGSNVDEDGEVKDYKKFADAHPSNGYSAAGVGEESRKAKEIAQGEASKLGEGDFARMNGHFDEARDRSSVVNSVAGYGAEGYKRINSGLRTESMDQVTQQSVKNIDMAFKKATATTVDIVLHRGTGGSNKAAKTFKGMKPGDSFSDKGFVSTSTSPFEAHAFGKTQITIKVPKGSKVLPVGSITGERFEKEVLLPRGSKFKVIEVESDFQITVELLGT